MKKSNTADVSVKDNRVIINDGNKLVSTTNMNRAKKIIAKMRVAGSTFLFDANSSIAQWVEQTN